MRITVVDAATTSELRRAELRPQWPVGSVMHGDDVPGAIHFAAWDDARTVVGACVLLPRPCPAFPDRPDAWQLRGMVAAPQHRGSGIGRALTEAAVDEAQRRGARLIWCDAREAVIGFYARHGFTGTGQIYPHPETGAPHLLMYRELSDPAGTSTP
ncbi:MAG TPA: GNAT family N-acetyltransferase [Jatrophihabitantaceae bacterium]|nr:GNAT family N-acetyltransferase [Jatrophihabitantaceae bacterium]